jgi:hypothetical protein
MSEPDLKNFDKVLLNRGFGGASGPKRENEAAGTPGPLGSMRSEH